jgi:hypothetical protein
LHLTLIDSMALAHRLSGIIRVATRWLRIISTNYVSYVLIFLPCSDSVGETFRSVGGLGPPADYLQWGTNIIASLLMFISGGGTSDYSSDPCPLFVEEPRVGAPLKSQLNRLLSLLSTIHLGSDLTSRDASVPIARI